MAKNIAVWGIDIGQCALKALRCTLDGDTVVADAFDFIEYPKILSQPEAEPDELIHEAMEQFLSRNDVKGDRVILSVSGQSGLSKFFKPPPVEAKKIPDIVKYEARQQIPFDLSEVVWDFQLLAGGGEVDGLSLDTEVGLFAMKRDQVYKALKPFDEVEVEVNMIQLAPIAIYNFLTYDMLDEKMDRDNFDPEDPPESMVILSMGTDTTDLIVTNGFRVWQRSIPIGGNHFTKQLTKEMKYTFAKAEHLKRNARQAEDPKALFQAMRPVFNDLVTEVQRSISFFQGIDRQAKIAGVVMMGNTVKLPGLKQYLAKNLGYEVHDFDTFRRLDGASVMSSPAFKDNTLAFGTCYGLCLQGLGESELQTNLMPQEILTDRLIRAKKPWAVASVAALILGCAFYYFLLFGIWNAAHPSNWKTNIDAATSVERNSKSEIQKDEERKEQLEHMKAMGQELSAGNDRMLVWMEMLQAVNTTMPRDVDDPNPNPPIDPKKKHYKDRPIVYIEEVESQYFEDLQTWWQGRSGRFGGDRTPVDPKVAAKKNAKKKSDAADEEAETAETPSEPPGPQGKGWVIELRGYHYFNEDPLRWKWIHVRDTLLKNLLYGNVNLPIYGKGKGGNKNMESFRMADLGISYALVLQDGDLEPEVISATPYDKNESGAGGMGGGMGGMGGMGGDASKMMQNSFGGGGGNQQKKKKKKKVEEETYNVKKYVFTVQFCWQEKLLTERLEALEKRRKEEAEKKAAEKAAQDDVAMNSK